MQHQNRPEGATSTSDIHKYLLVRRFLEKMIKSAHIKASDAHAKAAAAHRKVHAEHATAANNHKMAGEHVAAHFENIEAKEHARIAKAHEKASIPHLNEAYPDRPRVKPTIRQAVTSIMQSRHDAHRAKKSLKSVTHHT